MGRKKEEARQHARPLELIEEAVHLLRRSPPGVFAAYYLGTVPFALGFLFFWADMSRSFNATSRLIPAALGLAALYIFMKTMQTVSAQRLRAVMTGVPTPEGGLKHLVKTAALHSIYQPWGFLVLPIALLATVPFGWCFAFYQNLTVLGPAEGELGASRRAAWRQALLWPAQNHMALGILLLFSFIVMLNLLVAAIYIPHLVRTLFGIETVITRSGIHVANTTYLMIIATGTYLCVDPIVKAYYTLRCYYGQSLSSGVDLLTELRFARRRRSAGPAVLVLIGLTCLSWPAAASQLAPDPSVAVTSAPSVHPPEEIEEAVQTVLTRLEYSWRLPRDLQEEDTEPSGFLYDMLKTVGKWLEKATQAVDRFLEWLGETLRKLFQGRGGDTTEKVPESPAGSMILYILIFAGAVGAVLIIQKMFLPRPREEEIPTGGPSVTTADLTDENILASDLPENEWMAMARELLDRGEVRLGIRALYLASLAHLAEGGIITLARHKTDREYEMEMVSRGEVLSGITAAFKDITGIFERSWYGMHSVPDHTLDHFKRRHTEVMTHGA